MFPWKKVGIGGEDEFPFQGGGGGGGGGGGDDEEQKEGAAAAAAADPVGCDNELMAAVNVYRRGPPVPQPSGRGGGGPGQGRESETERRRSDRRETERLRRQEMASLFSSLRSLLPLHSSKGKRSMSDHIDLTAKYVKQLEGSIKELGDIKEQLLTQVPQSSSSSSSTTTINNCHVEVFQGGLVHVQIVCSEPKLSTSLKLLLEAGLDVVSCVSTRLTQGQGPLLHHTIHCQANGDEAWDEIRVEQLQHRLNQLVCSTNTSST